jgi:hypothetical protein
MVETGLLYFFKKTGLDRHRRSVALKKRRILA